MHAGAQDPLGLGDVRIGELRQREIRLHPEDLRRAQARLAGFYHRECARTTAARGDRPGPAVAPPDRSLTSCVRPPTPAPAYVSGHAAPPRLFREMTMRRIAMLTVLTLLAGTATSALAEGDRRRATREAPSVSAASIAAKLDALGYDVRRLKLDDGQYKVSARDRASGGLVKVRFDPANGELMRAKLDD
ncbi:MAG: hypothetical protein C3F17_02970 [Bradyrhizobiaceae bacterium]|nr:MAG: hypothetical protein C3F17_02970 [Bradyrhizobiaceae bacterium]